MKIMRVFLSKCGVHADTRIDFCDERMNPIDLVCLAGVNGSGKTTIMDVICKVFELLNPKNGHLSSFNNMNIEIDHNKKNILSIAEFVQVDLLNEDKIFSIIYGNDSLIQRPTNKMHSYIVFKNMREFYEQLDEITKSKTENKLPGKITPQDLEQLNFLLQQNKINKTLFSLSPDKSVQIFYNKLIKSIGKEMDEITTDLPLLYYFTDVNRTILDIRYKMFPMIRDTYEVTHKYNPNNDDLKGFLIYYEYAFKEKYEQLIEWINKNVLFDKEIISIDRKKFDIIIKTKTGDTHGLESLSSGEKSLLVMAIYLKIESQHKSIIMIDEVDKSLHPEFQEQIIKIIKKITKEDNCQIIISSHSRTIWEQLSEKQIITLTEV